LRVHGAPTSSSGSDGAVSSASPASLRPRQFSCRAAPGIGDAVTDAVAVLKELAERFPVPEGRWHRFVDAIPACHAALEIALVSIEADAQAARALDDLIARDPSDLPRVTTGPVAAALSCLDRLPVPEGQHPFIAEIEPTLVAMRVALHAVAASSKATETFA